MSNLPCSFSRNITSHTMKNLAFHGSLRWKRIILSILATSLVHFLFKMLRECTFWAYRSRVRSQGYWFSHFTEGVKCAIFDFGNAAISFMSRVPGFWKYSWAIEIELSKRQRKKPAYQGPHRGRGLWGPLISFRNVHTRSVPDEEKLT